MSYNDTQALKALQGIAKRLGGIEQNLGRIADALEVANKPLLDVFAPELHNPISYRDALKRIAPHKVGNDWAGGAMGCPGHYFQGAPRGATCIHSTSCTDCWNADYKNEAVLAFE